MVSGRRWWSPGSEAPWSAGLTLPTAAILWPDPEEERPIEHWIISNRELTSRTSGGARQIFETGDLALPTFRVATYRPLAPGANASKSARRSRVRLVKDVFCDGYTDVRPNSSPGSLAGSKRMFHDVYTRMCAAPESKGDTLFFIHGFNYAWEDALAHLQQLHEIYVVPPESPVQQIIYFTWPSRGDPTCYREDQRIAFPSGQLLGRIFAKTVQFYRDFFRDRAGRPAMCGRRIHLAAHSMGNQVLEQMIGAIREMLFLRASIFGEVLLLNADADWTALEHPHPLSALPTFGERTHVYTHRSDDALRVSEWTKNDERRLGRHGPRDLRLIPPRTIVVDASRLRWHSGIDLPDASPMARVARSVLNSGAVPVKERLFDHWGYLTRPELITDIHRVLHGESSSEIEGRRSVDERLYRLLPASDR